MSFIENFNAAVASISGAVLFVGGIGGIGVFGYRLFQGKKSRAGSIFLILLCIGCMAVGSAIIDTWGWPHWRWNGR